MKKIIDVPESADFVNVNSEAVTSTGGLTRFNSARYTTSELEDAPAASENTPKKRVIELPDDVIDGVQNAKTYWENVAGFVLNAPSVVFPEIRKAIGEPNASYDKVADILGGWYFGNIEFTEKSTEYYYVQTDLGVAVNNEYNEGNVNLLNYDVPKDKVVMTEKEAEKFVKKLAGLNARKVKVEE